MTTKWTLTCSAENMDADELIVFLKYGIKQESFDFDVPEEADITGEAEPKPKKRGRKKKAEMEDVAEEIKAFDEFA